MEIIFTSHPHAAHDAAREIAAAFGGAGGVRWLMEGVGLVPVGDIPFARVSRVFLERPVVFARHIFPVTAQLPAGADVVGGVAEIAAGLAAGETFSVQVRGEGVSPRPFSDALRARGFVLDIARPAQAVSVVSCEMGCFVGVSRTEENLSDWNGGMMHFREEGCISRAEFKLLEALRTFPIDLGGVQSALDLGAAPGGWSKALAEQGVPSVTAVDPAPLDSRLRDIPAIRYFRGTALEFQRKHTDARFDLITNDMKMDARLSLEMLLSFRPQLSEGGLFVATVKLPRQKPFEAAREALATIRGNGELLRARQLFHNRSEITVVFR